MVKIRLTSFDADTDICNFTAFGFTPEDEDQDPTYARSAPDFDDFDIPGLLFKRLTGADGSPADLVGQVFTITD